MSDYVKGSKPQDLDAAKGGLVLDRLRDFSKGANSDDINPLGTGKFGLEMAQEYGKKAKGKDPHAKRTGDKSC